MPSDLKSIDYSYNYRKGLDNSILNDFLIPAFRQSSSYDRMCGYFRSSVFEIYWEGLIDFIERGGKIRILCSYDLDPKDLMAIHNGELNKLTKILENDLKSMIEGQEKLDRLKILSSLIASDILEIRIGLVERQLAFQFSESKLHEKLGIFMDLNDNYVAFQGSMNETSQGVGTYGNTETITPFLSWDPGLNGKQAHDWKSYFKSAWNDKDEVLRVVKIPSEFSKKLIEEHADKEWKEIVKKYVHFRSKEIIPRDHQKLALENWFKSKKGVLKHATGSGKTITSIMIIQKLYSLNITNTFLIIVPNKLLLYQWEKEIENWLEDPFILLCGDGNNNWKKNRLKRFLRKGNKVKVAIAILKTSVSTDFINQVMNSNGKIMLIADEVHEFGRNEAQIFLETVNPEFRLGLSATPERHRDEEGTKRIFNFFGDIVDPIYNLADAINDGHLTKYYYFPSLVDLTKDERTLWNEKSKEIKKIYAIMNSKNKSDDHQDRLEQLYRDRANIVKTAYNKYDEVIRILNKEYQPNSNQKWLIYCSKVEQIQFLKSRILNKTGFQSIEYHSDMNSGAQKRTMEFFKDQNSILISADMLDQGVDIPAITHAIIISSTQNPRKYIQRRGRVLRKIKGKTFSFIFDIFVLPVDKINEDAIASQITVAEIKRGFDFSKDAYNLTVVNDLELMCLERGINIQDL